MDVQGSSYHLLNGEADWGSCVDSGSGTALAKLWAEIGEGSPPGARAPGEYAGCQDSLQLRRDTPLFRRAGRSTPLDAGQRRGAGRDSYGNWFWIDDDRRGVEWRPAGGSRSGRWWSIDDAAARCTPPGAAFAGQCVPPPMDRHLQGLTVTTGHYLLVGYLDRASAGAGLLVFDLQSGGAPLELPWPDGFVPWDLADTADGGALVLDAANCVFYRLDAQLRLRGTQHTALAVFQPATGSPTVYTSSAQPSGVAARDAQGALLTDLVAIEPGPGDSVLLLQTPAAQGCSVLHCFDDDALTWSTSLAGLIEGIDPADPLAEPQLYSLRGHDFVRLDGGGPLDRAAIYIADADGKQVIAFDLEAGTGHLDPAPDFLPLRRWGGKAIVRTGSADLSGVWYDFGDRWIPVEVFTECRFESSATITTTVDLSVPASAFDSRHPGCVWHRLFLDAHIPTGTTIEIRARAADDPALLEQAAWRPQPTPYLRTDGPELPWYDAWPERRDPLTNELPDRTGTWELLFQQVVGQYLQLEISLYAGGHSTPQLRSLRAWYPRFSYPEHYLPAVYPAQDSADAFLERFLANFEGYYTALEERIEHSHALLDARTVPGADLPWLASWFGLVLEPQWDEMRRRFLVRHMDLFYRWRGTVIGLVATLRAYLLPTVDESIFCDVRSGAGGVRVVERFLTRGIDSTGPDLEVVRTAAHRFDVLVPMGLDDAKLAMIDRILQTARPAHTWFDVRRYYDLFVVGSARLGFESELGDQLAFVPVVTGENYLGDGYLAYPYPTDIADRIVLDRDRVGGTPQL